MISATLLIAYLNLGASSCSKKQDIDIGIFSKKYQKFYFANEYTEEEYEFDTFDQRADKLVCVPYKQYIQLQKDYVCKKR